MYFHIPYTAHCRQMTPIVEMVGSRLKNAGKNLDIYSIDASENDVEEHHHHAYPTLKLYLEGNNGEHIEYHGPENESHFVEWLEEKIPELKIEDLAKQVEDEEESEDM